ncbi:hypothetical protein K443DRAFT_7193 [Laccaria amethystina LaAM-08-1]|uniref:Unplaced genomic scaffold K443scaffold_78, whole genome shotgun sequence n=1 Tax=Laccaria amethystina LaAM-08-1 TaxID=1095629 RepID=A0A0C9WRB4_9AGAR|nr:hypothetical protein K443DRAFT_7193 [Laccaria amethystina LaAM-08-1]
MTTHNHDQQPFRNHCRSMPRTTITHANNNDNAVSAAQWLVVVTWHDTIIVTVHISSGAQLDSSPAPSPFFTQQASAASVTWQPTTTEPHSVNTTTNNDHLLQSSFDTTNTDPNNNNN